MFKELFASMNEALDGILTDYADANESEFVDLGRQLRQLKSMSDSCLEEWLQFEERLASCRTLMGEEEVFPEPASCLAVGSSEETEFEQPPESEHFGKGQGYYKLSMFSEAAQSFERLISDYPDFIHGRVYLAMAYLRLGELEDAYRHFKWLVPMTNNARLKAISYSAMGCIQIQHQNLDQAYRYFKLADQTDSSCMEPMLWMKEFWPYRRT
ncbi:tetratricopeptide repeat protein [Gorillibacterium sp. CAU 1737]|uniref:tetratricopeptide repeat protein n=1 Tax=Gorillibacterium sp. CAU 1737 TaxID=3140362 RepID=UPI003260B07C